MKKIIGTSVFLFISAIFFFVLCFPVRAVYFNSGSNLVLAGDKKINETVFIGGDSLTVDSNITGDLFCAGKSIVVNGDIKGDVICAGQNIIINGDVDGNIRAAGQLIEVNGAVSKNLTIASQSLLLSKPSSVKGDVIFGAQVIDIKGSLGRDLGGYSESVSITGSLVRNAQITTSKLTLDSPAKIGGNFDYFISPENTASVSPKFVKGVITRHDLITEPRPEVKREVKKVTTSIILMEKLYMLVSFFLLGSFLIYFLKSYVDKGVSIIGSKWLSSAISGLGVTIISPIAMLILLISIVGAPLAFALFLLYVFTLFTAVTITSLFVGKLVVTRTMPQFQNPYLYLFVGLLATGILFMLPVVGWLFNLLAFFLGVGSVWLSSLPEKK